MNTSTPIPGKAWGAAHQTGWTGLIANLVTRRYRKDIPQYWRSGAPSRATAGEYPMSNDGNWSSQR